MRTTSQTNCKLKANDRALVRPVSLPAQACGSRLPSRRLRLRQSAFTLAELLIVVVIILMVTVATIPLVRPALDTRRIRESGRLVSTQFASAQSEALANGRSAGVWLERLTGDPTASMDLFLCEVPPPYSGDSESSTALVTVTAGAPPTASVTLSAADTGWVGLLRPGDLIRFNYSGPYYSLSGATQADGTLQATTSPSPITFTFTPVTTDIDEFDSSGNPVFRYLPPMASMSGWTTPYQILRQPMKASNVPMQLPAGDVVDLYYSGMGSSNGWGNPPANNNGKPVIITFDRSGALESCYINGAKQAISGPLYFLIGKRDKLFSLQANPSQPDLTHDNLNDLENVWIAINPQTGLVTSAELASGGTLQSARSLATSAQTMGGN